MVSETDRLDCSTVSPTTDSAMCHDDGNDRSTRDNEEWGRIYEIPFAKWVKPFYIGNMKATVTIDKAGRVVLPKILRDELHLTPGDTLDLAVEGERVTLCPRRPVPPLQKERGVWVFRIGESLTAAETRETLRSIREQRARRDAGESR